MLDTPLNPSTFLLNKVFNKNFHWVCTLILQCFKDEEYICCIRGSIGLQMLIFYRSLQFSPFLAEHMLKSERRRKIPIRLHFRYLHGTLVFTHWCTFLCWCTMFRRLYHFGTIIITILWILTLFNAERCKHSIEIDKSLNYDCKTYPHKLLI